MPETRKPASASAHPASADEDKLGLDRLVFFSDAVYAIAITLLVIDIRLPAGSGELDNQQLLTQLLALLPKYLAYALSFWVIGGFWARHHAKFMNVRRYDGTLIVLNLLNLMFVAFLPFPTSILAEYGNRTATILYALTVALAGFSATVVGYHILRNNRLVDADLSQAFRRRAILRSLATPAIFLLSIGVAFIDADLAKYFWLLLIPVAVLLREPRA